MEKQKVKLMCTHFEKGWSEVVEDYRGIEIKLATRMAFAQKARLNASDRKHFYWVKCINF